MLALHWPAGPWPLDAGLWTLVPSDTGRHRHWSLSALVVFGSGRCEKPAQSTAIIQQPIRRIVQTTIKSSSMKFRSPRLSKHQGGIDGHWAACHRQDAGDRSGADKLVRTATASAVVRPKNILWFPAPPPGGELELENTIRQLIDRMEAAREGSAEHRMIVHQLVGLRAGSEWRLISASKGPRLKLRIDWGPVWGPSRLRRKIYEYLQCIR